MASSLDKEKKKEKEKEEDDDGGDVCMVCLDELSPTLLWKDTDGPVRFLCCGKQMCLSCWKIAFASPSQFYERLMASMTSDEEDVDEDTLRQKLDQLMICPHCRQDKPSTIKERFELLKRNAEQRHWSWSYAILGSFYESGQGTTMNKALAVKWYKRGAEAGCCEAQHEYGRCLSFGVGVKKVDMKQAVKWYEKAARSNHPPSVYKLGQILLQGFQGTRQDFPKAFQLLQQAAQQGVTQAQSDLAHCYETGKGVELSLEQAIFWGKQAAEKGDEVAMFNYAGNVLRFRCPDGRMFRTGNSPTPEALYWYRKAHTAGFPHAQSMINQLEQKTSCARCGQYGGSPLKQCSRCKAVWYCGASCQKADWRAGHKVDCFNVAQQDKRVEDLKEEKLDVQNEVPSYLVR